MRENFGGGASVHGKAAPASIDTGDNTPQDSESDSRSCSEIDEDDAKANSNQISTHSITDLASEIL